MLKGHYAALLTDILLLRDDTDEALVTVEMGLDHCRMTGESFLEPELHRLKGVILMNLGAADDARASLARAVEVAREQGAKPLETRAAKNLRDFRKRVTDPLA
jgi:predicted negative regulator of RcsB-dependent stress response